MFGAKRVGGFTAAIQRFGIGRLAAILGVAAGVAAVLVAVMLRIGQAPDALLYSNLDLREAGEITSALGQAGIKYSTRGDGSTIMVNRDEVGTARLLLAICGTVGGGALAVATEPEPEVAGAGAAPVPADAVRWGADVPELVDRRVDVFFCATGSGCSDWGLARSWCSLIGANSNSPISICIGPVSEGASSTTAPPTSPSRATTPPAISLLDWPRLTACSSAACCACAASPGSVGVSSPGISMRQ